MKQFYLLLTLMFVSWNGIQAEDPFVPAAGGTLPAFTEFTPVEGMVGGFLVYSSVRHNDWFGSGTYAEVNMSFPNAATLGAETLVLQYKKQDGSWTSLLDGDREITTTGDNFSLTLYQSYTLRLLLRGGAKNGYVTNEQVAGLSSVNTYFSSVSMDESMFLTGVMAPWVGRGLQVSYQVKQLSDNSVVSGGLTVQWYRVNPVTYESTPIAGADSLLYATTTADLGYKLMARATGNETTVGGFYQMMSSMPVVGPNKCFVTNQGVGGFTLNLYQDLPKIDTGDLMLRDKDWAKVPIASVTRTAPGVFQVAASLSLAQNTYYLQNKSNFWRICTEMAFGPMHDLMEGVTIDLTANGLESVSKASDVQALYDAAGQQVRFVSVSSVKNVSLYSPNGALLGRWNVDREQGGIPVGRLNPGVYFLRFQTNAGLVSRKLMIHP